jgi:hypothetical protein
LATERENLANYYLIFYALVKSVNHGIQKTIIIYGNPHLYDCILDVNVDQTSMKAMIISAPPLTFFSTFPAFYFVSCHYKFDKFLGKKIEKEKTNILFSKKMFLRNSK